MFLSPPPPRTLADPLGSARRILSQVHPVLFHIGAVLIPSYGALAALGVLLALFLAQRTARIGSVDPARVWNLVHPEPVCGAGGRAAASGRRQLERAALASAWLLALAMVHHPLLAGVGALAGAGCAAFMRAGANFPFRATADALAPPLALGLAFEQLGALLAGSGYGTEAGPGCPGRSRTPIPLAAMWSGAPLGVPLHPVQAYAALAFLTLAILLRVWLPLERRQADVAGLWLMGTGVAIFITELWRDPEGRGSILQGASTGRRLPPSCWCLQARWCCASASTPDSSPRYGSSRNSRRNSDRAAQAGEAEILHERRAHDRCARRGATQRLDRFLDHFLAAQLEGVSRSRVQLLIEQGDVQVNGEREKPSIKLRGGERI